jgi:ketosteroid isomerase-like protein
MAEHPNVQRIRDSYSALAAGDLTEALKFLAPAGVIHFNRRGPLGRYRMGIENIKAALVTDYMLTAGTQRFHISGIYADDRHGVVVLRETASRPDGATLDLNAVHLLAFDDEGRLNDLWDITSDREAQVRFFEGK